MKFSVSRQNPKALDINEICKINNPFCVISDDLQTSSDIWLAVSSQDQSQVSW